MKTDFRSLQINEMGSIDLEQLKSNFKGLSLIPLLEGEILKSIFVYQDFETANFIDRKCCGTSDGRWFWKSHGQFNKE